MKAPVLNITQTGEDTPVYTFTARGVEYTIIDEGQSAYYRFIVYSQRKTLTGRPVPRVMALEEMLGGSNKTLKAFATIITA